MRGWLFDLYARGATMVLWFLTDEGERLRLVDDFPLEVYLSGPARELQACIDRLGKAREATAVGWTERLDFWTGTPRRVFALRACNPETWRFTLQRRAQQFPALSWYNADLLSEQCYCYARDIFPLMRCTVEHRDGRLLSFQIEDDRWDTEFLAPPLRTAELSAQGTLLGPRPRLTSLTLSCEGEERTWDEPDGMLEGFQAMLDAVDPDAILTSGGDSFLFPLLLTLAERCRFPLRLGREEPERPPAIRREGRSFMSYGRVLYQAPEYPLLGRWHLDRRNSFTLSHNGLEGLFEVARVSRLPVQRIGRRSIGTGITSVQLDLAWREGYLIPWKKTQPEAWKSAAQLLKTDRGGLVYAPETGFYEDVVELDFVSMYPSIMSLYNVSPETVNCPCCHNQQVPGIGYTICERRKGLVARALLPIIAKRVCYKARRRAARQAGEADVYTRCDERQDALKWMLVCCFGYLGYRNARFGRIEAHEAVSAYSREMLLRAREVCEEHGWHMIHANVDCVWIVRPGFREEEIPPLCEAVSAATGLPIALEGIYRWLAFLPSRQIPDRPVPTRYYGVFRDGTLKYRGIECRRRDWPLFFRRVQLEALEELAKAPGIEGYRRHVREWLLPRIAEWEGMLSRHEVPLEELLFDSALSQDPSEYRGNGPQALAARQSISAGLNRHAGESLRYLFTPFAGTDRARRVCLAELIDASTTADPQAYRRLLRRTMNTLLWPADVVLEEDDRAPRRSNSARFRGPRACPQMDLFGDAGGKGGVERTDRR